MESPTAHQSHFNDGFPGKSGSSGSLWFLCPRDYERKTVQQLCAKQYVDFASETRPARKNEVALQQAEMRMVRRMCGIKLKDRFSSKELRDRD